MEILSDPTPDMLAMPRFDDGAIDMQELLRRFAEQVVHIFTSFRGLVYDPYIRLSVKLYTLLFLELRVEEVTLCGILPSCRLAKRVIR